MDTDVTAELDAIRKELHIMIASFNRAANLPQQVEGLSRDITNFRKELAAWEQNRFHFENILRTVATMVGEIRSTILPILQAIREAQLRKEKT